MSAEGGGEVGSGGEAEDADAVRVDVPCGGVFANDAEGALGVLQGSRGFGIRAAIGDAVLEEDAGDACIGEPIANFGALEIDGEDAVGAAGKNYDGGAGVFSGGRIESQRWS